MKIFKSKDLNEAIIALKRKYIPICINDSYIYEKLNKQAENLFERISKYEYDREVATDKEKFIGCLAEVTLNYYLHNNGVDYQHPGYTSKGHDKGDIKYKNYVLDIKSSENHDSVSYSFRGDLEKINQQIHLLIGTHINRDLKTKEIILSIYGLAKIKDIAKIPNIRSEFKDNKQIWYPEPWHFNIEGFKNLFY